MSFSIDALLAPEHLPVSKATVTNGDDDETGLREGDEEDGATGPDGDVDDDCCLVDELEHRRRRRRRRRKSTEIDVDGVPADDDPDDQYGGTSSVDSSEPEEEMDDDDDISVTGNDDDDDVSRSSPTSSGVMAPGVVSSSSSSCAPGFGFPPPPPGIPAELLFSIRAAAVAAGRFPRATMVPGGSQFHHHIPVDPRVAGPHQRFQPCMMGPAPPPSSSSSYQHGGPPRFTGGPVVSIAYGRRQPDHHQLASSPPPSDEGLTQRSEAESPRSSRASSSSPLDLHPVSSDELQTTGGRAEATPGSPGGKIGPAAQPGSAFQRLAAQAQAAAVAAVAARQQHLSNLQLDWLARTGVYMPRFLELNGKWCHLYTNYFTNKNHGWC